MIYPTPSELLRCVNNTLLEVSDETVPRMAVKSALATCRHLIRYAELRTQLEKSSLLDDIDKAGQLLGSIAAYLDQVGNNGGLARALRATLAQRLELQPSTPEEAERIQQRASTLREHIYVALKHLQSAAATEKATDAYQSIRRQLREYMQYQIEQEGRMIKPAFIGQGPRR